LPFFQLAITDATRKKVCEDAEVKKWVIEALSLPAGKSRDLASELAGKQCWRYVKGDVAKAVDGPAQGHLREAACPLLRRNGLMKGHEGKCR
jgi:hypothetical protein